MQNLISECKLIKAVIFDMDGVLIDAKEWHYTALNRALKMFGYEISRHDHLVTYDGLPTRDKLQMLTLQDGLPKTLHGFINELKQKYTMQLVYEKCAPTFAHQYALSRLNKEGYAIAVASNSIRATIEAMMSKAELDKYLDFILSNEDVVVGKPNPAIYIKAIERLGLAPSEVVIVEDNPHGIAAARSAGGNVLKVDHVTDVNYWNIRDFILALGGK
ncbi:MAG: HAD family phosphatase [Oceanospirillaceae bacterium]|nr:HAD family phosphatase [Oceanospirillaceae bacterium]